MRLLLVLLCLAAACTTSSNNDLSDLRGKTVQVDAINRSDGSQYLSVRIGYASVATSTNNGCAALAVDATFDGNPFTENENGGWKNAQSPLDMGHCAYPTFGMLTIPSGPATIELADASGKIEIAISDPTANHGFAFAAPTPSFHAGDTLAFVPSIGPSDTIMLTDVSATTPAAMVVASDGSYCGVSMFDGNLTASGADFRYRAPDVYTRWLDTGCNEVLTKGTSAPADLEPTLGTAPAITTCQGADTCGAFVMTTTALHTSYVP